MLYAALHALDSCHGAHTAVMAVQGHTVSPPLLAPPQGHPYHTGGLTCLDVHPDSTAVVSGSEDGVPKVTGP